MFERERKGERGEDLVTSSQHSQLCGKPSETDITRWCDVFNFTWEGEREGLKEGQRDDLRERERERERDLLTSWAGSTLVGLSLYCGGLPAELLIRHQEWERATQCTQNTPLFSPTLAAVHTAQWIVLGTVVSCTAEHKCDDWTFECEYSATISGILLFTNHEWQRG